MIHAVFSLIIAFVGGVILFPDGSTPVAKMVQLGVISGVLGLIVGEVVEWWRFNRRYRNTANVIRDTASTITDSYHAALNRDYTTVTLPCGHDVNVIHTADGGAPAPMTNRCPECIVNERGGYL